MREIEMDNQEATQLFAVLNDAQRSVRRLPVTQALQGTVRTVFVHQTNQFKPPDAELLDFEPSLRPDESHIIRIADFMLPTPIIAALQNPLGVEVLDAAGDLLTQIAGLFIGELEPSVLVRVQSFDRRQVLTARGLSIILSGGTFRKLEEPGLALDTILSALVVGTDLFIKSYNRARRVLDLTEYYREATDAEIDKFASNAKVYCDNLETLKGVADSWVRRKVALLLDSPSFNELSPRKAVKIADKFNVKLAIRKTEGKERIVLPSDRKSLKELLCFLDEDYWESPLSGTKFVSHSKRKLKST
jgi:hypothetical protein